MTTERAIDNYEQIYKGGEGGVRLPLMDADVPRKK